ncbi:putative non-specific serine/threonine protein kinase [Helianthus anomalus]
MGSGSFGEIYLGTNVQTNEEVAIKFVVDCYYSDVKKLNFEMLLILGFLRTMS